VSPRLRHHRVTVHETQGGHEWGPPAPRVLVGYRCERGHDFAVTLAAGAGPPAVWRHSCGADATRDGSAPSPQPRDPRGRRIDDLASEPEHDRIVRLLRMRRTDAQGAALLAERLAELHKGAP